MAKQSRRPNIRVEELELITDSGPEITVTPRPSRNPRGRRRKSRRKKNPAWLMPVAVATGALVAGAAVTYAIRRYQRDRVPAQLPEMT